MERSKGRKQGEKKQPDSMTGEKTALENDKLGPSEDGFMEI